MAGSVCGAALARRQTDSLNALAGEAVILLVVAPMDLSYAGFQLSFVIVLRLLGYIRDRSLWRPAMMPRACLRMLNRSPWGGLEPG